MTPAQCKAARDLLGMTRERLAALSDTNYNLIAAFETTGYSYRSKSGVGSEARVAAMRAALEAAGAEFTDSATDGVRLRSA